jgi:hypothetical protein
MVEHCPACYAAFLAAQVDRQDRDANEREANDVQDGLRDMLDLCPTGGYCVGNAIYDCDYCWDIVR